MLLAWLIATTLSALAGPGFLRPADPSLPAPVRAAALGKTVVHLAPIYRDPIDVVDKADYPRALKRATGLEKVLLAEQFRACDAAKQPKCELRFGPTGSGFLVGDGRNLWTARHVLESAAVFGRQQPGEPVALPIALRIYNQYQQKLFDSAVTGDQAIARMLRPDNRAPFLYERVNDFAIVRLSRVIEANTLPLAHGVSYDNTTVYGLGFSAATGDRAELGGKDSRGLGLLVGKGQVKRMELAAPASNPETARLQLEFLKHALVSDVDQTHGASGGPVLNAAGEVVGLIVGAAELVGQKLVGNEYHHGQGILLDLARMLALRDRLEALH